MDQEEFDSENSNENKEGNNYDDDEDSFDAQNKDLIDNQDSQNSNDEENIHAWGAKKDQFYQSSEQVGFFRE